MSRDSSTLGRPFSCPVVTSSMMIALLLWMPYHVIIIRVVPIDSVLDPGLLSRGGQKARFATTAAAACCVVPNQCLVREGAGAGKRAAAVLGRLFELAGIFARSSVAILVWFGLVWDFFAALDVSCPLPQ